MGHVAEWGVLAAFLAIAAFFLLTEHQAHLWGIAPWLLLFACPLLHFFMHGRHGGHGRGGSHAGHERGRRPGDGGPAAGPGAGTV